MTPEVLTDHLSAQLPLPYLQTGQNILLNTHSLRTFANLTTKMVVLIYGFLLYHLTIKNLVCTHLYGPPDLGGFAAYHISALQKDQNWSFWLNISRVIQVWNWEPFLGHLIEKADASKFQTFEIKVFVFNYRQISIRQMFENLGYFKIFKGEWTY